jgi:hypothetical protein
MTSGSRGIGWDAGDLGMGRNVIAFEIPVFTEMQSMRTSVVPSTILNTVQPLNGIMA